MWVHYLKSYRPWQRPYPPCWTGGNNGKTPRRARKRRIVLLIFAAILLVSGCVNSIVKPNPTLSLPVRPDLTSLTATPDGGICLDRHDAAELLLYIEALERGAGGGAQ